MKIFKLIVCGSLLLLLIVFFKGLYANRPEVIIRDLPLGNKEINQFIFRMDYLGFIPAGEFVLEDKDIENLNGKSVYHLKASAKPNNLFNFFYKVNLEVDSFIDTENFLPLKFIQSLEIQGKPKEKKVIFYDQKNHVMDIEGEKRVIFPNTYEPLSLFFFFLRNVDLNIDKTIDLNINTNQENYQFLAKVIERKTYNIKGYNFDIYKIKGRVKRRGKSLRHSSSFSMFLLNRPLRVPVLIKVFSNVGPISVRLIAIGK